MRIEDVIYFMDNTIEDYLKSYQKQVSDAFDSVDLKALDVFVDSIITAVELNNKIYVCGNGGSAAIAEHFTCDHLKGVREGSVDLTPKVISLASNLPLITAIANDISYDKVFSYQLESLANPYDVLVVISSSGNSQNILDAIDAAKEMRVVVHGIFGFDGGLAKHKVDNYIHIDSNNYGVIEDVSQSIMHIVAQHIAKRC